MSGAAPTPCHVEVFLVPPRWDGTIRARRLVVPLDGPPDRTAHCALGRRRALWLHSTSWRWHGNGAVLTYLALLARTPRTGGEPVELSSRDLRSKGQRDPRNPCAGRCPPADALRHGLRHLASLCRRAHETPCLARLPRALRHRLAALTTRSRT